MQLISLTAYAHASTIAFPDRSSVDRILATVAIEMTSRRAPSLIEEIIGSKRFQEAMIEPMIQSIVHRLSAPGADGRTARSFLLDWLYLQRPMFDRFIGGGYNVQFEGPPVNIDGTDCPLGGYICRDLDWAHLNPIDAIELRELLRAAIVDVVERWIAGRPLQFLPAVPQKPLPDRAAADAEAERAVREYFARRRSGEGDAS
jgi:hypothetical protein